jgi:hypothetical protein
MKPIKYYQIVTPDENGVLRPFEVNQFNETEDLFREGEAETFIEEHFLDRQETGSHPPIDQTDLVLAIIPVYKVRFKK